MRMLREGIPNNLNIQIPFLPELSSDNTIIIIQLCFVLLYRQLLDGWMDGWIAFNSISVISGRYLNDNERLCAMEPCL